MNTDVTDFLSFCNIHFFPEGRNPPAADLPGCFAREESLESY